MKDKTFDIDADGQRDVLFADSAEQGAEMHQPIDAVIHHHLLKTFEVEDIGKQVRPYR